MKKKYFFTILVLFILFEIDVYSQSYSSFAFKTVGSVSEKLMTCYPLHEKDSYPAIIFLHGGSFTSGGPEQFLDFFDYFTKNGYVTFSVGYRLLTYATNKISDIVEDSNDAINWVFSNSRSLKINPKNIFVCGFSAGSYLALASVMLQSKSILTNIPKGFVLIGTPVNPNDIDPQFLDTNELNSDIKYYSPYYHIIPNLPPMLFIQGTKDEEVSYDDVKLFVGKMKDKGNNCQLIEFEGRGHHLFNSSNDLNKILSDMEKFFNGI
jgi:acetyl esterase